MYGKYRAGDLSRGVSRKSWERCDVNVRGFHYLRAENPENSSDSLYKAYLHLRGLCSGYRIVGVHAGYDKAVQCHHA